jgi:hypothetical protein
MIIWLKWETESVGSACTLLSYFYKLNFDYFPHSLARLNPVNP